MAIALFLSHLVGDYWLQWDGLARWKSREYKGVLVHGLIVLAVTWLFSLPFDVGWWPWVLFIWLTHTAADAIRLRLGSAFPALALFLLDQAVHFGIITFSLHASGYLVAPLAAFASRSRAQLGAPMIQNLSPSLRLDDDHSRFDDQVWRAGDVKPRADVPREFGVLAAERRRGRIGHPERERVSCVFGDVFQFDV